jgi:hypothetical protein
VLIQKMPDHKNISSSRRRFLGNGLKLAALTALLMPIQKALGNGTALIAKTNRSVRKFLLIDKLVMNTKTKVVHLPTGKIFTRYNDIESKNQKILDLKTWETQVKTPVHFNKEKSGIILELLALQKLNAGITDKSLTSAINTLALAFSPTYKNKTGLHLNKYNFRIHELLAQLIALNNSIPTAQKWTKFQTATGTITYTYDLLSLKNHLPPRVKWMLGKNIFDERMAYIIKNKNDYMGRLKKRAADYKLS